ncbi:hypothetical protein COY28_04750 [Candidatus Woesearchaeota archaeon CG_4_10_14_0_2_um_filter_57_5]|nr:MAG: hypothetical protein COV94_06435 [Candidatus Woesearchaeota archaeon CG11_big_fil_rev_8_21_14_0_20_57_5]PIZ51896.1 MAG: hypothetical protein COY28_04750 [Candidatus Woesearchaeota archaeon CG_4_10_14_0_2_um_filter_57_5]
MPRKRDRLEIVYTILRLVRDNKNAIKVTPLLRYTNVSSQSFSEYYTELLEKGFIREELDRKKRKYVTLTDKGFAFLEKYAIIQGVIDEFEL